MSAAEIMHMAADAAGGAIAMLGKRKADDNEKIDETELKKIMTEVPPPTAEELAAAAADDSEDDAPNTSGVPMKGREIRLEQNRKAARESRRRKKVMIEELQRSVIFFSRANGTLKQQNDELTRLLMQAQAQVKISALVSATPATQDESTSATPSTEPNTEAGGVQQPQQGQAQPQQVQLQQSQQDQQAQAQAVATQALYESQGFPAAAARAAAQTMNCVAHSNPQSAGSSQALPPMQPGATMQAMANFQQAAAAAMQAAMAGMQGIPGVNLTSMTATHTGANAQQAYTDTMTALAMQQAAAAHMGAYMGQHNPAAAFIANPMAMGWPPVAAAATAPVEVIEDEQEQQPPVVETEETIAL